PAGAVQVSLSYQQLSLASLSKLFPASGLELEGVCTGEMALQAPSEQIHDVQLWKGKGTFAARPVRVQGRELDGLEAKLGLESGRLLISGASAHLLEQTDLHGKAELGLAAPFPFEAQISLDTKSPRSLFAWFCEPDLVRSLNGSLTATAKCHGNFSPRNWAAS